MESETIATTTSTLPIVDPVPPTTPPELKPTKPPKLLYIFGGVAVILVSIALAITMFGQNSATNSTDGAAGGESSVAVKEGWPKYTNTRFFYELRIPPKWVEIKHSQLSGDLTLFNALDTATLEVTARKTITPLDEILALQDKDGGIKATSTREVKVGEYDALERNESWSAVGLQSLVTYVKIQDMYYAFTLTPASGKNALTNESIIRDYRASLASFRLTDTSQLGQDLRDYSSQKIDGLVFPPFSLKYPQSWVVKDEFVGKDTLITSIYRNNYEIRITQAPIGEAVCLFKDSPDFQGSSGDLRNKDYTEFTTGSGVIMRRYFNVNEGDKSTIFFCRKESDSPYFATPTDIGGIAYYVPAKFDLDIVKEMDEIVKSIAIVAASPSPETSASPSASTQ